MSHVGRVELNYYSTPGPSTELTRHLPLIATLSSDPAALSNITRGLILHDVDAMTRGIEVTPSTNGMSIIGAPALLDRILELDAQPLDVARPPEERIVGFCYHFALLHCALLRANGVASRPRCGFASYLIPDRWTDHWIVEHWTDGAWQLHDPQIGIDVTPTDFRNGVMAWQLCRSADADPALHGNGELWGWDELRGTLVNDVGSLNKVDVGNWDWCELLQVDPLDQPHPAVDEHLDDVAKLATGGDGCADLRAAFDDSTTIRPPDSIIDP